MRVCVCVCISMCMLPEIFISFIQFIVFQWKGKAKVHNVPQFWLCLPLFLSLSHCPYLCLTLLRSVSLFSSSDSKCPPPPNNHTGCPSMHNFHSSVDVVLLQCVNPNRNVFTTKGGGIYRGGGIEMKLCGSCCVFSFVSKALCSSSLRSSLLIRVLCSFGCG